MPKALDRFWGIMSTDTGEVLDVAYVKYLFHHQAHIIINHPNPQPFNHDELFKGLEENDNETNH